MIKNKNYNGLCDLYRFLFAIMIMFHHAKFLGGGDKNAILGGCGHLAVEFFFILSGYFMAISVSRKEDYKKGDNLGLETVEFVFKKITAVLPYYILAVIASFTADLFITEYTLLERAQSVFDMALLSMTGIKTHPVVNATWYLSAMFIAMLIIYPLFRRLKTRYSMVIGPVIMIAVYGFISQKYGTLDQYSNHFDLFFYTGLFRAIADISFGIVIFEIVERLKNVNFTVFSRILFSFISLGLLIAIFATVQKVKSSNTDFLVLFAIAILMTLTFSKCGIISRMNIFYSKFFKFLGTMSLVIYLNHFMVKDILKFYLPKDLTYWQCLKYYIPLVFITVFAMMFIKFIIGKLWKVIKSPTKRIFIKGKES